MNRPLRSFAALVAATLAMMGGNVLGQEKTALVSEREKVSYAVGMDVGKSFAPVSPYLDLSAFERAVKNAFEGKAPLQSEDVAKATDAALRMSLAAAQGAPVPGLPPGSQPPPVDKVQVGLMLGDRAVGPALAPMKNELDLALLMQAMRTAFEGGQPLLSEQEATSTMQALMAARQAEMIRAQASAGAENRVKGAAFLAQNANQKGVVTTPSGLQYLVLRQGSGARPTPSSRVRVNYEGKLLDGTVFDSSYQRNEPATFRLDQVIPGWTEGVAMMPVGSKYRFWVPSNLAYGPSGTPQGGPIGPDATLTFDVELMGILQ